MSRAIPWISSNSSTFPCVTTALTEPNGLLAFGDDLSTKRILQAYQLGIFPWFSEGDPVMWWSPNPRAIIHTNHIKINKTLKKVLKRQPYQVTINQAFEQVIRLCADAPFRQEETWILEPMIKAYCGLHQNGHAHSIEVWQQDILVGGLYGVAINGYFSGESMFYTQPNASKIALVYLAQLLKSADIKFIDCQLTNPFLASMGCVELVRSEFLRLQAQEVNRSLPANFWHSRALNFDDLIF